MRPSKAAGTSVRACALFLLEYRDRTEAELRRKLCEREYGEEEIEEAISWLKSCRYLDDERYSHRYIESHIRSRSVRQICAELARRGVSRTVISCCMEEVEVDEGAQIRAFLEKKGFLPGMPVSREDRQRIVAALMRRGYPPEAICRTMDGEDLDM
ncbi:MAG: RecX family transcriptional regulator [Clostridiales bacterium]|nr:RecX family transcriptional regulator [Clostridiales bacterium]